MHQEIITYIVDELTNEELDEGIGVQDDLLGTGILDSLGMMRLIAFVEETYEIKVAPEEMVIENFMTVENISTYIKSKS